jgi:NAD(P)-dependent dehydrogenase (short-subunit alcohol dehydrogenase family)
MSRVILITGASGKFGLIFVKHLLEAGHTVIGATSTQESLDVLEKRVDFSSKRFIGIVIDLCEERSAQRVIEVLEEQNIYPDCLINAARSLKFLKTDGMGLTARYDFLNEYLLDVVIPYELAMKLTSYSQSLRTILNIGSQYGIVAANPHLYDDPDKQSPIQYSVAKAALSHLTKELAVRLAKDGIQVNCIAYGGVEGRVDESFKDRYSKLTPIGRMLFDDEITWPLDALLSDGSMAMTGQTINFDGGWTIW